MHYKNLRNCEILFSHDIFLKISTTNDYALHNLHLITWYRYPIATEKNATKEKSTEQADSKKEDVKSKTDTKEEKIKEEVKSPQASSEQKKPVKK